MSGLLRTIRKAEAGSQELLDSIEEGMRLGLDQKIDDVLDKRERELVRRGREPGFGHTGHYD